jgi:hypothetical protein
MKVKYLTLASAGSLLMVGAAQAAFLGVEIKSMDHWFGSDITIGGGNVQTSYNAGSFIPTASTQFLMPPRRSWVSPATP